MPRLMLFQKFIKTYFLEYSNMIKFKDCVPYNLVSGVAYEYRCGRCNSSYYGETERHLKVRSEEHI